MMNDEAIWKLLARKMNGEASPEELRQLQDLIKDDPVMRYTAQTFSRVWDVLSKPTTKGNNPAIDSCEDS